MSHYWLLLLCGAILYSPNLVGQVYLTKNEALSIHLGDNVERKTVFLTDEQVSFIQKKAKAKVESKIVTYYQSARGTAFFETRTIRTMPATYVVVIAPDRTVSAVEMVAFYEPDDYLPPKNWLKTFHDKSITDDLWLKRGVYNISGATLSAHAVTESVRRILATFDTIIRKEN